MKPTISVITISYNASQEIEKTLRSALSQTYTDYEYVFIDGASSDGTVEIIESYRAAFEAKGITYRVYSEPDKGIYDAMNKGIEKAAGEWAIMLNAGDRLVDEHVFYNVFEDKHYDADVVYGNTVSVDCHNGVYYYKKTPAKPLEYMNQSIAFCHQSVFVRSEVLRKYRFDMSFRIVADYEQFLRMRKDGVPFTSVDTYISMFELVGFSMQHPEKTLAESVVAREKNGFSTNEKTVSSTLQKLKFSMRNTVKNAMPWLFFSKKRGWYRTLEEAMRA